MRRLLFTATVGLTSRTLILRDRLYRRHRRPGRQDDATVSIIRHRIPSGRNFLDAVLACPSGQATRGHLVICHGIGETVDHWLHVQTLLAAHGIASLVFNYSGYGRSTGWIDAKQCEQDAIAAFAFMTEWLPDCPVSLLGFSLGSGIAAAVLAKTQAHQLILCASFTSLQDAACSAGLPRALARLLPAIWNTKEALHSCTVPVLILHGEKDQLFPAHMADTLAAACHSPCELIVVPELSHNGPIYEPKLSYWSHVLARL